MTAIGPRSHPPQTQFMIPQIWPCRQTLEPSCLLHRTLHLLHLLRLAMCTIADRVAHARLAPVFPVNIQTCATNCEGAAGFMHYLIDCRCCASPLVTGDPDWYPRPCASRCVWTLWCRYYRWSAHHHFWWAPLHSSQPGHRFAVALLGRGDRFLFRRDWRNQEASRRLASLCALRSPVLHKG